MDGQPQRLSPLDSRNTISDSLNYMETYRGNAEELPRHAGGHKSNRE